MVDARRARGQPQRLRAIEPPPPRWIRPNGSCRAFATHLSRLGPRNESRHASDSPPTEVSFPRGPSNRPYSSGRTIPPLKNIKKLTWWPPTLVGHNTSPTPIRRSKRFPPSREAKRPHESGEHSKAHRTPLEAYLEEELNKIISVGDKGELISPFSDAIN